MMNPSEKLTYEDFKNVLTPQNLKALQIVYFALGFGIFIFTITFFFIYSNISGMVTSTEDSQILMLSVIHFSLLIICFLYQNISLKTSLKGIGFLNLAFKIREKLKTLLLWHLQKYFGIGYGMPILSD